MMKKESRALFTALQNKKSAKDVQALITAETAKTPDPFYNMKPLFWALSYGASAEVLKLLLQQYPEAANEKHPTEGWTPLHYAERLDAAAVKLLVDKCPGAANEKDSKGALPLHWAAEHNAKPDVVEALLQANKDAAFAEDNLGRIPVKLATDADAAPALLAVLAQANPTGAATLPAPPPPEPLPIGIMFPGVGSQKLKMLSGVKDIPAVADMLKQAKDILGWDVLEVCTEGPDAKLQDMAYSQPLMFVAGMAGLEKLRAQNPEAVRRPQAMSGLSLGEYTALCAAGVFSFADGLSLVKARAEAMKEASNRVPQTMLSVAGLEFARLQGLCTQVKLKRPGDDEVCQIANYMFQKGFTVTGTKSAVEELQKLAESAKALQARLIKGSGAFHSPLMEPARQVLEAKLAEIAPRMKRPRCKVFMNTTAKAVDYNTDPSRIAEILCQQMVSPVKWKDCMEAMVEEGVREFYECGPMGQLRAMMKRIDQGAFAKTAHIDV